MNVKLMQVFYGEDNLPYKDSERLVHYPIVGNAFMGASETTEIRFYTNRMGVVATWVVNGKLPNGKIVHQVLETKATDTELNEDYYVFHLSSAFTQFKGDLFLSLSGYSGDMTYEEDDGNYTIKGTPVIQTSGSIKLNIAYSVGVQEGDIVVEIDDLLALLTGKISLKDGIIVLNTEHDNLSGYASEIEEFEDGQVFLITYQPLRGLYYKNGVSLSAYNIFFGYCHRAGVMNNGTVLSSSVLTEIKKRYCFFTYGNANFLYFKTNESLGYAIFKSLPTLIVGGDYFNYGYSSFSVNLSNGEVSNFVDTYKVLPTKSYVDDNFAKLDGNNTFTGLNTFENYLPQSEVEPSNLLDIVNKNYVDKQDNALGDRITANANNFDNYVALSQKGNANGVATLDSNSKIPLSQLPDSVLGQVEYCGTWNASLSTDQTIRTPRKGDYYICATSGGNYNPDGTNSGLDFELGDWAIYDGSAWEKIDNTDAVQSVNGKTGAVVLTGNDIEMGGDNHTKLDVEIDKKIDETEANDIFQTKIIAYPLLNIPTTSWTQDSDTGLWYYTTSVSSSDLSIGANDKYCLGGNDKATSNELSENSINVDDIVTSGDTTTISLVSKFQPSIVLNVSIVIAKVTPSTQTGVTFLTTSDIGNGLKFANNVVQIDFGSITSDGTKAVTGGDIFSALANKQDSGDYIECVTFTGTETFADLYGLYGGTFTLIFKYNLGGYTSIYTLGLKNFMGNYDVEIESLLGGSRFVGSNLSSTTTIATFMSDTYRADYFVFPQTSYSISDGSTITNNGLKEKIKTGLPIKLNGNVCYFSCDDGTNYQYVSTIYDSVNNVNHTNVVTINKTTWLVTFHTSNATLN